VFPLYGKLPKSGIEILKQVDRLADENNPLSLEKIPLRRTRIKSDLKMITDSLMK